MISPRAAAGETPRSNLDVRGGVSSFPPSPSMSPRSGPWRSFFSNSAYVPGNRRLVSPSESFRCADTLAAPLGGSWGVSPGLSILPSLGVLRTPPRTSASSPACNSDPGDLPSSAPTSLKEGGIMSGAGRLSPCPGSSDRLEDNDVTPQSRHLVAKIAPEARHSGRHSSGSRSPGVPGTPSEAVAGASVVASPAACVDAKAERGADHLPLGGSLVLADVPFVENEVQSSSSGRSSSSGGTCAKRPVATVSIATQRFWLRFENDDIEAM